MIAATPALTVRGGGIAATLCAHLLERRGRSVRWTAPVARAAGPVIMLGEQGLALLRDLLERPDLFAGLPAIERRIALWGGAAEPAVLPHHAIVATAAELEAELPAPPTGAGQAGAVPASPIDIAPLADAPLLRFGERPARAVPVSLGAGADPAACLIEATPGGWLFLIPRGAARGWLLAVGAPPEALLAASRLVAPSIDGVVDVGATFETAPRLLERLTGPDWLACGSRAMAFDPLCGDGTAQAARQAILAAAVACGLAEGGDPAAFLGHYRAMSIAAMRRHLQVSLPFYRTGGASRWWRAQATATAAAHARCTALLAAEPEPRFLLRGLELVPRGAAA